MTVSKIKHSGAWEVSDIINGHLLRRTFYGYTKRGAVAAFRAIAKFYEGA